MKNPTFIGIILQLADFDLYSNSSRRCVSTGKPSPEWGGCVSYRILSQYQQVSLLVIFFV